MLGMIFIPTGAIRGEITYEKQTVKSECILTALAFNLGRLFLGIHQKTVHISTVKPTLHFYFSPGQIHLLFIFLFRFILKKSPTISCTRIASHFYLKTSPEIWSHSST